MRIKIKIRRCDPMGSGVCEPFYQVYNVEVFEGMTVLEALLKIFEQEDPSLSFRRSCRSAICGSCAMNINGFPRLACNTQIIPLYKKYKEIRVEPLSNHTVIKDLVVDFNPFWRKMEKITPYLTPKEQKGEVRITKEDELAIDNSQRCIMCGCCNASCNALEVDEKFVAPAALAKSWRFVGDVREGKVTERLEKLSGEHGMWDCVRCVHCTEFCPKDVAPLRAIERLRSRAMDRDVTDNPGAKHVEAMVDSVKRVGRLDEAAMTFKTLGFLRSLGMIPLGIKMELHGKMPHPIIFPKIEDIEEVRKIYETREKGKEKK